MNHVNQLETKVKDLEGEKKFTNTFHKNKLANVSAKLHGMKWKLKAKVKSLERRMLENNSGTNNSGMEQKSKAEKATETSSGLLQRNRFKGRILNVLTRTEPPGLIRIKPYIESLKDDKQKEMHRMTRTLAQENQNISFCKCQV